MSRRPNTDARRAEIVRAMLAVIARHGYEKATIQAIAKQAGLAPGLIHYHFESKQAILVALIAAMAEAARAGFEALGSDEKARPRDRLHAYLQARLGLGPGAAPDAVAAWVMIGAEAVRQEEVRAAYAEVVAEELRFATGLVEACLAEAGRELQAAPRIAAAVLALMAGAFQLASAVPAALPAGFAAEAAIALADARIAAAPSASPQRRRSPT
jgi:TetR/AcrR family transcriptional repressor of bet genes